MNNKKFIEKLERRKDWKSSLSDSFNEGYKGGIGFALDLATKIDEPKPINVKPFVADWYEKNKHALDLAIFTEIRLLDDEKWPHDSEFKSWLDQAENKPIETLIRMKDGYEVEKEQLYYVDFGFDQFLISGGNLTWIESWGTIEQGNYEELAQFTESVIKAIDERYWPFAVKVED